jgi:hypothetical protein
MGRQVRSWTAVGGVLVFALLAGALVLKPSSSSAPNLAWDPRP